MCGSSWKNRKSTQIYANREPMHPRLAPLKSRGAGGSLGEERPRLVSVDALCHGCNLGADGQQRTQTSQTSPAAKTDRNSAPSGTLTAQNFYPSGGHVRYNTSNSGVRGGDSGAEPPAVAYPELSEHGSASRRRAVPCERTEERADANESEHGRFLGYSNQKQMSVRGSA